MRENNYINYVIAFTLIGILIIGTFFLPQMYNYRQDSKDIGTVHYFSRGDFVLNADIDMSKEDRIAIIMKLVEQNGISSSLRLDNGEMQEGELAEKVRAEVIKAVEAGMFPEGMLQYNFDADKGLMSADYFYINNVAVEIGEMALWYIFYTDYISYEVRLVMDASTYTIYFAEYYYETATEEWSHKAFGVGNPSVIDNCKEYYGAQESEAIISEGFFKLDDINYGWTFDETWQLKKALRGVAIGYDAFWKIFERMSLEEIYGLETNASSTNSSVMNANEMDFINIFNGN